MKILTKRTLRGMKQKKFLYSMLFFVTLLAMFFYVGINYIGKNLHPSIKKFYESQNLSSYTLQLPNDVAFSHDDLQNLKGAFETSESCFYQEMILSNGASSFQYYIDASQDNKINIPLLKEGRMPEANNEILIDYGYSRTHNLHSGDYYHVNEVKYLISGIAIFPEYIFKGKTIPNIEKNVIIHFYRESLTSHNLILLNTSKTIAEVETIVNETTENPVIIVKTSNSLGYIRVNSDLDFITTLFTIIPIIIILALFFILFINYVKIIDNDHRVLGVLKANGFTFINLFFNYLLPPLLIVLIGSIAGTIIGYIFVPKYYLNLLESYYVLPEIRNSHFFNTFILPTLSLVILTILTYFGASFLTLKKQPTVLMRPMMVNNKGVRIMSKWHLRTKTKLIIRNILTYKRKILYMVLSIGLTTSLIVFSVMAKDSVDYLVNDMGDKLFNGNYTMLDHTYTLEEMQDYLVQDDKKITNVSWFSQTKAFQKTTNVAYVYESNNSAVNLLGINNKLFTPSRGMYIPYDLHNQYSIGDDYLVNFEGIGSVSFAVSGYYRPMTTKGIYIAYELLKDTISEQQLSLIDIELFTNHYFILKTKLKINELNAYLSKNLVVKKKIEYRESNYSTFGDYQIKKVSLSYDKYQQLVEDDVSMKYYGARKCSTDQSSSLYLYEEENPYCQLLGIDYHFIDLKNSEGIILPQEYNTKYQIGDSFTFKAYAGENEYDLTLAIAGFHLVNSRMYVSREHLQSLSSPLSTVGYNEVFFDFDGSLEEAKEHFKLLGYNNEIEKRKKIYDKNFISLNFSAGINFDEVVKKASLSPYIEEYDYIKSYDTRGEIEGKIYVFGTGKAANLKYNDTLFTMENGLYLSSIYQGQYSIGSNIVISIANNDITLPIKGFFNDISDINLVISYQTLYNASNTKMQEMLAHDSAFLSKLYLKLDEETSMDDLLFEMNDIKIVSLIVRDNETLDSANLNIVYGLLKLTQGLIFVICGLVMILLVYNILSICLYDRLNDIKIFKSLGMPNWQLGSIHSFENYIIALFGGLLALFLGNKITDYILNKASNITGAYILKYYNFGSVLLIYAIIMISIVLANIMINTKIKRVNIANLLKE